MENKIFPCNIFWLETLFCNVDSYTEKNIVMFIEEELLKCKVEAISFFSLRIWVISNICVLL